MSDRAASCQLPPSARPTDRPTSDPSSFNATALTWTAAAAWLTDKGTSLYVIRKIMPEGLSLSVSSSACSGSAS